jgi:cytochrome c553
MSGNVIDSLSIDVGGDDRRLPRGGTMRNNFALCFASLAIVVTAASAAAAQANTKADQGAALFTSQKCTMCHSYAGKGNPKGALDRITAKNKAEHIRQWLQDPDGMRARENATRTPAMKPMKLSGDQIDALIAYLTSAKPTLPAADAER